MSEHSLAEIDLADITESGRPYFPSPAAWEDEVLYFLLVDRFSDGREKDFRGNGGTKVAGPADGTPPFVPSDSGDAVRTSADAKEWREAGTRFVGGNLRGLTSKLGYLKRLGVTAVWVSPVLKQVPTQESYHGYGVQNLLDVDPHFGTRETFRDMVKTAHDLGIRIILDVILNHSGDVFGYDPDRYLTVEDGRAFLDPRWDDNLYKVKGYRDAKGVPDLPFGPNPIDLGQHPDAFPDGAIWPREFQTEGTFTRKGRISNFDHDPEFREGDFFGLKDIALGRGGLEDYEPSESLLALCDAYKFWIAFADLDGFRVDTVKHMDTGAARFFTNVIREFAQSLGKENFYLIGEITGGRELAFETLEVTGLDAALGISDEPGKLEGVVRGQANPEEYFDLFRNSLLVRKQSHVWFRNKVVSNFDDHDKVRQGGDLKSRFCADDLGRRMVAPALALETLTLGIPNIYYGTEQQFDGQGGKRLPDGEVQGNADRWIRETMFGGKFGAFRSRHHHFFDEAAPVYQELSKILSARAASISLRRGRQFLREISGNGSEFGFPRKLNGPMRSIVAWSRIFNDLEVLVAINTDPDGPSTAHVIVDNDLHAVNSTFRCIYSTESAEVGQSIAVQSAKNGTAKALKLSVPAAGCVIYA